MTNRVSDQTDASDPRPIAPGSSSAGDAQAASSVGLGLGGEHAPAETGVPFPIVGIGASAGGLEAVTQLLRALPTDTGSGVVIIQHLAPDHASNLAEILSRATMMSVCEVRDEPEVEPNCVYVIPPGRTMIIAATANFVSSRFQSLADGLYVESGWNQYDPASKGYTIKSNGMTAA